MTDYSKSKIYKIVCNTTGEVYIGSTVQSLSKRLRSHKKDYKRFHEGRSNYMTSFVIIERGNYEILLVESYSCNSRQELHQRERFYIEHEQCVNKIIPCRSKKEYEQDNREKKILYKKQYYENNKERVKEYDKERRKLRVECEVCNCTVIKSVFRRHERTLKHLRNLASRVQ